MNISLGEVKWTKFLIQKNTAWCSALTVMEKVKYPKIPEASKSARNAEAAGLLKKKRKLLKKIGNERDITEPNKLN